MSKMETISLRIFGRDLTLAWPPKEKNNLIRAADLLNSELENIKDKNNALIIAGLTLANKLQSKKVTENRVDEVDYSSLIKKINETLEK